MGLQKFLENCHVLSPLPRAPIDSKSGIEVPLCCPSIASFKGCMHITRIVMKVVSKKIGVALEGYHVSLVLPVFPFSYLSQEIRELFLWSVP